MSYQMQANTKQSCLAITSSTIGARSLALRVRHFYYVILPCNKGEGYMVSLLFDTQELTLW